MQWTYKVYI